MVPRMDAYRKEARLSSGATRKFDSKVYRMIECEGRWTLYDESAHKIITDFY